MYFCDIRFQIEDSQFAYIIIEANNKANCINKVVTLFRDVWSQCTFWHGAGGMMETILLAQQAGHTVYAGAGKSFSEHWDYVDSEKHTCISRISRYTSDGGDDFIECTINEALVFGGDETKYPDGMLFDDYNGMPDFVALANLVDATQG